LKNCKVLLNESLFIVNHQAFASSASRSGAIENWWAHVLQE
jgi:hypothetical protein